MADAVTSQTILDGERLFIGKFTNISDGTGEVGALKIDVSGLNPDAFGHACNGIKINKVWAQTYGMAVDILWDGGSGADVLCETIPADVLYKMCYDSFGGIPNNAAGTGDVLFSTVGAAAGDRYTIIIEGIKTYSAN